MNDKIIKFKIREIELSMECKKQENLNDCPCTYPGCPRKGVCCDCLKYHLSKEQLPACCFSKEAEATYDRSFNKFVEENSQFK